MHPPLLGAAASHLSGMGPRTSSAPLVAGPDSGTSLTARPLGDGQPRRGEHRRGLIQEAGVPPRDSRDDRLCAEAPRKARLLRGRVGVRVSQSLMTMGVPSPTAFQISSISWFLTAIQPSVQSRPRMR